MATNRSNIGGDSDTLACITDSIAEAYYGIPKELYDKGSRGKMVSTIWEDETIRIVKWLRICGSIDIFKQNLK